MNSKAVVNLTTGLEDGERVTVAFLTAVAAAESGRATLMFLTKEAVRLAVPDLAHAVACDGCPSLAELVERYAAAGGELLACPICLRSRQREDAVLAPNARAGGTVPMWEWIGDGATVFSF